jgi:FeS assembly protein IscX
MTLTWETSFAIAVELKRRHTDAILEDVSLLQIYNWTLQLEEFEDDPSLCNDGILAAIYQEWFEEKMNDR